MMILLNLKKWKKSKKTYIKNSHKTSAVATAYHILIKAKIKKIKIIIKVEEDERWQLEFFLFLFAGIKRKFDISIKKTRINIKNRFLKK